MFYAAAGVWLLIVVAGFVFSIGHPARLLPADRFPGPAYVVAVVAAVVVGVAPLVPPAVDGAPEPDAFSIDRARAHIAVVARQPHPIGSAAIDEVRQYLATQVRGLGLDPEFQAVSAPDYYGVANAPVQVVNVMARIPGSASTGAVALVAHYDTVPTTPGANDNASGVAVVLEAARGLLAGGALRNDVILLFTDGEEPAPRFGSTAFVADHPWADEVRFVVNLEAIGTDGPSLLTEMTGPRRWVLDGYVDSVPHPAAFSFLTETTELIGGSNTDFAPFRDAGVAGVEFVYATGSPIYHTGADTPDRVGGRSLQAHGANTLELARHLAYADLSSADGGRNMVFFTVGRYHVVSYPAAWAVPIVVLAGAALAASVRRRDIWRAMIRGAATALAASVIVAIAAGIVWGAFAGWRDSMGVVESYAYLLALAALSTLVIVVPLRSERVVRWRIEPEAITGAWCVLALLTALSVPGMSYLFGWPALVGGVALLMGFGAGDSWKRLGPASVTVGAAAVLMVPAIDTFFQFAQPRPGNPESEILLAVAIPVMLIVLMAQLALSFSVTSTARRPATVRSGSAVDSARLTG